MTEPAAPRVTRRRAQTRSRLLAAAAEVFAEKGFGRSTVEDVCNRAGFSRGAFYSNFLSLDELFIALYSDRATTVVAAAVAAVTATRADAGSLSAETMMARAVATLPVSRESQLINLEFTAHALRHPEVAATFAVQRRQLRAALVPLLRTGLQLDSDRDPELDQLARVIIAVHEGLYLQELLEPDDPTLPTLRSAALGRLVDRPVP